MPIKTKCDSVNELKRLSVCFQVIENGLSKIKNMPDDSLRILYDKKWQEEVFAAVNEGREILRRFTSDENSAILNVENKSFKLPLISDIEDLTTGTDEFILIFPNSVQWQKIDVIHSVDGDYVKDSTNRSNDGDYVKDATNFTNSVRISTSQFNVRNLSPLEQSKLNSRSEGKIALERKGFCQANNLFKRRKIPKVKMTKAALLRCGPEKGTSEIKRAPGMEQLCTYSKQTERREIL